VDKLTFQQKLWVPLICSLVCIAAIFIFDAMEVRRVRIEERQADLTNIDESALGILKMWGDKAQSGAISKEEAQNQAKEAIKAIRYGKDGYITINSGTTSVMHPIKPELNGKDLVDLKDPKGTYVYREIAAASSSPEGAGFVRYYWERPGSKDAVPKLSRVVAYKPWDWGLVTGVYMDDIDDAFRASLLKSGGVLLVVVGALAAVVSVVNRSLRHTIGGDPEYVRDITSHIAEGDLTLDIKTHASDNGSILHSIKTMQQQLVDTISEIRRSADTIATASSEIASGNMDLSSRTEAQASALEETAASMEQLTSTVNQNTQNAVHANDMVSSTSGIAVKGGQVVQEVIDTMATINAASRKIVDIISVIDGIAFQTNILALNAAVEAARAGEQGRGFAVVASEVRNLAQRSAAAAKEIKALIGESVDCVDCGGRLVTEAGTTMREVVDSVQRVTHIMAEIADASREQSTGIGHVNQAITEMDSVTQQNAALVEQAAAAAASLQDQSATLAQLVARFRLNVEAQPATPRRAMAAAPQRQRIALAHS
jgi:methyl-accepting chemotaxis protein